MERFELGTRVRVQALVTVDAVAAAPGTMTWTVRKPDDTDVTYVRGTDAEATAPLAGTEQLRFTPATAGIYRVKGVGTVSNVGAAEISFRVDGWP